MTDFSQIAGWGLGWGFEWPGAPTFDHVYTSNLDVWAQFQGKPYLLNLLETIGEGAQWLEDAADDVFWLLHVDHASGVQLDKIGALVDRSRDGLSDADYRNAIKVEARTLLSTGSADDMLELARAFMGPGRTLSYHERYPASFMLVAEVSLAEAALFASLLSNVPAGGVGATLVRLPTPTTFVDFGTVHPVAHSSAGWFSTVHSVSNTGPPYASFPHSEEI